MNPVCGRHTRRKRPIDEKGRAPPERSFHLAQTIHAKNRREISRTGAFKRRDRFHRRVHPHLAAPSGSELGQTNRVELQT